MADQPLAQLLRELFAEGDTTLGEAVAALGERGFGALLALLALPAALPLPAVGYAVPFGIGIFLLGLGLVSGRERPWLPGWLRKRRLPRVSPDSPGFRFLARLEWLFRKRGPNLAGPLRVPVGLVICCLGALMMIPIPGTNTLPGVCSFLLGLGVLYQDGVWLCLGGLLGVGLLGLYGAVAFGALRFLGLLGR